MTQRPRGLSEMTSVFQGVDATPGLIRKGCQPWDGHRAAGWKLLGEESRRTPALQAHSGFGRQRSSLWCHWRKGPDPCPVSGPAARVPSVSQVPAQLVGPACFTLPPGLWPWDWSGASPGIALPCQAWRPSLVDPFPTVTPLQSLGSFSCQ